MTSHRHYPVPRAVSATARPGASLAPLHYEAVTAAGAGQVRACHLPVLASSAWDEGREWAKLVLQREDDAASRKLGGLLASVDYDPSSYSYHGLIDPGHPDVELMTAVVRASGYGSKREVWDGMGWSDFDLGEDDVVYAVLDESTLADLLEAISGGSGGLILRPTEPRGWIPGKPPTPLDQYAVISAAGPPRHTGAMVALYPSPDVASDLAVEGGEPVDEMHLTLAYLGDTDEEDIDYQAVQRAVSKWARLVRGPLEGEVSGKGLFTAGPKPVTYASVDVPDLPSARQALVHLLAAEGVPAKADHGYTPHMTIAYDDLGDDWDPTNHPLSFNDVVAKYGDDAQRYELGTPVVAAGGTGPDIIYAIVDEMDTAAVLELIRVSPGPIAYRRESGKWVADRDVLLQLMSVDPPPVVEVDAARTADVVAQVDAHDAAKPPKKRPVTAAGTEWDDEQEKKHPRDGGKFAKKQGQATVTPAGQGPRANGGRPVAPPRGPAQPGRPSGAPGAPKPAGGAAKTPTWTTFPPSIAASGVGPEFFADKPDGFRAWLAKYLEAKAKPEPAKTADKSSDSKESNADKQDAASEEARKTATDKANAAAGKSADAGPDLSDVPPKYRAAMRQFLAEAAKHKAEGSPADRQAAAASTRAAAADSADRKFELGFAKQGLAESRRREMFDRQLSGLAERLRASGADPGAVKRLLAQKAAEEKQRRAEFAARRRLAIQQERVRRLALRDAEKDQRDREAMTADASRMPGKLKTYWSKGEGAAKIRWGTGGDFNRCRKALAKYLPAQMVSGACASLHHLATGSWPGKGRNH